MLLGAVMFILVLVALLAVATAQSGSPQYIQGQWIVSDDSPQYEEVDGLAVQGRIWPAMPPDVVELVTEDKNLLTTQGPYVMKEQDSDKGEDSAVWKIALVAAILLVSIVGSLSMAYYMCVWRGGRINYQHQKEIYT
ncbi:hypothetical protein D9C73_018801 [Collichthys lucidus]|uniref:Uncharacterized protein n=1 Tax=Collichthys lucidus TaxID=240159 RepID=A0A4U5VA84_COLLU|nr:hypothetical protein D9C73_018801 [Collichthys lucidus]